MTTLTVNIDNKQSEKILTDILDSMGFSYNLESPNGSLTVSDPPKDRPSIKSLFGSISKEDVELIERAIEEGCEQINPDDWR